MDARFYKLLKSQKQGGLRHSEASCQHPRTRRNWSDETEGRLRTPHKSVHISTPASPVAISPITHAGTSSVANCLTMLSAKWGLATTTKPMPQLKTLCISASAT